MTKRHDTAVRQPTRSKTWRGGCEVKQFGTSNNTRIELSISRVACIWKNALWWQASSTRAGWWLRYVGWIRQNLHRRYNAWASGLSCEHEPVLAGGCLVREAVTGAVPGSCRWGVGARWSEGEEESLWPAGGGRSKKRVVVLGVGEELFLAMAVDLDHVISSSGESLVASRRTFVFIVNASWDAESGGAHDIL
jgi:hypothetical protein